MPMKIELQQYVPTFIKEVSKRAEVVDPEDELDWYSLSIGWAIAKGLNPSDAQEFANHMRYTLLYGLTSH